MRYPPIKDPIGERVAAAREVAELEAELRRIANLVVDVMHERAHSGELLAAIEEYRDR